MSEELRIAAGAARRIAAMHEEAASAVTDTGRSLPPRSIDGGEAAGLLTGIVGELVGDFASLAKANLRAAAVMGEVADDYAASEGRVTDAFSRIEADVASAGRRSTGAGEGS